jgi:hypothetical protein
MSYLVALGILTLLTAGYIWVISSVFKDEKTFKQTEVDGDGGCGCIFFIMLVGFVLCYLWTAALFVGPMYYGAGR